MMIYVIHMFKEIRGFQFPFFYFTLHLGVCPIDLAFSYLKEMLHLLRYLLLLYTSPLGRYIILVSIIINFIYYKLNNIYGTLTARLGHIKVKKLGCDKYF